MGWSSKPQRQVDPGAALLIVLALVVLVTGLVLAYFSRTVTERQIAHGSFNLLKADELAVSAANIILADLKQEIVTGSTITTVSGTDVYLPTSNANMLPMRSGNPPPVGGVDPIPNLIRRSVQSDSIAAPGVGSRASAVNSAPADPANPKRGEITLARWNRHYLIPKSNTGNDASDPVAAFAAPDWVLFTRNGPAIQTGIGTGSAALNNSVSTNPNYVLGRYAYAIYDEGGLLDLNVAGYPTGTDTIPTLAGRKGSLAFVDLAALPFPISNASSPFQVDRIVGWRNYGVTEPTNNFPDSAPQSQAFARNFQTSSAAALAYYNYVINNTNGFLTTSGIVAANGRTDQPFLTRQQLIAFRSSTQFSSNALQYLTTFSRATNSPSFSPATPAGSTIDYAALASSTTAINPNFLLRRASSAFMRADGTTASPGEPLVKTRFPLSRLAWLTYKGPSAVAYAANSSDAAITQLTNVGVTLATIQAGTPANIKASFGLVWDSRAYVPATSTTPSIGQQWVYDSPSSSNSGGDFDPVTNPTGNPASDIKRLDTVVSENREPDFFELLRATILDGSLGQNTGGGVTGGTLVFPDIHMSNKAHHILSIGASIIDQADPDSRPTRIQFRPGTNWWTAYGVESLPYITHIYPIAGASPAVSTQWATYLLFQLANPHNGVALSPAAPQVRLRVDGDIGLFTSGNNQTYNPATDPRVSATGQSIALTLGSFAPSSTPAPITTDNASAGSAGSATGPCGFETLPPKLTGQDITNYIGLRLLPNNTDYTLAAGSGYKPRLTLFYGADSTHRFNATMEFDAGGGTWVPYNHFVGINDRTSWINGDLVPVRIAQSTTGLPEVTGGKADQFNTNRLNDNDPASLLKSDPRSSRFGVFQLNTNVTGTTRITAPLWPSGPATATTTSGYGGMISPTNASGIVEHVPLRFDSATLPYYPATFCRNTAASSATVTSYSDLDGVLRPGDAAYPDPSNSTAGSSTPYYATSKAYWPITLNRPFRNVGELGYAFRDLPWKTLDVFSDKSADAGLLDVFCISDEPVMVAGRINLNTRQSPPLQAVLSGTIWDELNSGGTVTRTTGTTPPAPDSAQTMAPLIVSATAVSPLRNRSELVSRAGLPPQILPVYTGATANQTDQLVKQQREAVPRALASVSQTRTWNLMIDLIAQSGRYPPGATDLTNFVVEGEQRYWVHVAIDRFTGEVIDRQIEVVKE